MTSFLRRLCAAVLCLASTAAPAAPAFAQTAALGAGFTYQGRLQHSGEPINAAADFQFKLFDAATGGAQVGGTQPASGVSVVDGAFAATINFGPDAFNGDARWLEIGVRSPAGEGAFITLSPRQPLTATPYALKVPGIDGHSLDSADASIADAVFVTNDGNVGIGTTTPGSRLEIADHDVVSLTFRDTNAFDTRAVIQAVEGEHFSFFTNASLKSGIPPLLITDDGITAFGEVRMGATGQFKAAAGEESLRILRGASGGGITTGSGFSSMQLATGTYRLTFEVPFVGLPIVTANAVYSASDPVPIVVMVGALSTTGVDIEVRRSTDGAPVSRPFRFIAIGPR